MWQVSEKPIPIGDSRLKDAKVEYGGWVRYPPEGFAGEVIDGYSFYEIVPEHDPETGEVKSHYLRFVKSSPLDVPIFYVKRKSALLYWSTRKLVAVAVFFIWEDKKGKKNKKMPESFEMPGSYYEKRFMKIE
ncbi:MAG: hypothetical protein HYT12_00530 [Candidatus Liptonbacteria bacterium]|nr:hypothetical protein [Candidatus Liptonbacteria bacterium]